MLLLSTLDWALIETWKDSGIPLEAVLRGIDAAFDKYDKRPARSRKVNSIAYCAQAVMAAAEDMKEAVVGARPSSEQTGPAAAEIASFLRGNAAKLEAARLPERAGIASGTVAKDLAENLRSLASGLEGSPTSLRMEELEIRLTLMEEKMFSVLLAATPDEDVVLVRGEAEHELAPYRRKMSGAQIVQLQKQFVYKRLLEKHGLPRLSLFYM